MAFEAIQSLVAWTIERVPDRVAVECPHGLLTYAELDVRADDVAVSLQRAGVRPASPVVLLAEDRREFVAGLLGVLRVGGVAIPLDPVTDPGMLRRVVAGLGRRTAAVVGSGERQLAERVLSGPAPDVAVHVPCTAGVSGRGGPYVRRPVPGDPCCAFPTGRGRRTAVRTLGSVDHDIRRVVGLLRAGTGCRVSQLGPLATDTMLRDVFVPLTCGGTVCVPPTSVRWDGAAMRRWIHDEWITVVHAGPVTLRLLLDAPAAGRPEFPALRQVVLDGEEPTAADARRWHHLFGDRVPLVHFHGSTVAMAPCRTTGPTAGHTEATGAPALAPPDRVPGSHRADVA
ncbi:AMP-binding protein [Geodermatophilus maliterrae]|uniref:AMP-binding protein n=1 Tax=Geodermatophilus maliterrae TaxID=3162531 RepID=A0ABV3XA22_9ACTN